MFTNMLANTFVKPGLTPVYEDPSAVGLEFDDVAFKASDGVELSGWLVKGSAEKIVVMSHFGVMCCKAGYTPAGKPMMNTPYKSQIRFVKTAKTLVDAGYSVFMYDLRNHGKSSGDPKNPWVCWGSEEAKDVVAAVDYVSNHPTYQTAKICLLSVCMGGSATTFAYGREDGLKKYKNIKSLVVIQPLIFPIFCKALGIPEFMVRWTTEEIEKRTSIDFNTSTFLPYAEEINVPTLVIQNKNDPMTQLDFPQSYVDKLTVEKEYILLDLAKSRFAAYDWLTQEPKEVVDWFNKHL